MKLLRFFLTLSFLIILFPVSVNAQDLNVHYMIGKSRADVIKKYGAPLHKDDSNSAMVCMFYQQTGSRMIFVSDADGVYQAESYQAYDNNKEARSEIDKFISSSISHGFNSDTLSATAYKLHKTGINVDLDVHENEFTHKYDVSVKAVKRLN